MWPPEATAAAVKSRSARAAAKTIEDRLAEKTVISSTGCWLWAAAKNAGGYGVVYTGENMRLAHVVSYRTRVGEVPVGLVLDHLCRVRHCVNPAHLEPVTVAENNRRSKVLITVCPAGHDYDEANTYTHQNHRHCKRCKIERQRERYVVKPSRPKTENCPQGHPRAEFAAVNSKGHLICRQCSRDSSRAWKAKRDLAALLSGVRPS